MPAKTRRSDLMSRFHFKLPEKLRRISAVSGGSSGPPTPRPGGRRLAFSAVHFKKEKIMKQLQSGIEKGDTSQVEDVVEYVDIAELEEGNLSFVRRACELGNLDIVAVLLRNGASVNLIGDGSCAPIHVAARTGNSALTAILLSNSANPHSQAKYEKKTPLHVATLEGHIEVIRLLIANGADVNIGDIYGSRPIHIASRMARIQILQTLLESHAHIDVYDNEGWTALHLAAEAGHEAIVRILLDSNANVDSQSKYGRTPLHWACVSGHVTVVHTLLQKGACANIRDLHEHLPLYYAKNDAIKTLVKIHTDKQPVNRQKFASSIGLYINSKGADQASILSASPTLGDTKVRRWMSADPLAESRRTSSSLDEDVVDSSLAGQGKRTSHRIKHKAPVTIIIPSDHEDLAEEAEIEMSGAPVKHDKPSLNTSFAKMVGMVNGHMDDLDSSVTDLGSILRLASEGSIQFSVDSIKEYMAKLGTIGGKLKLLKNSFSTESDNVKNVICDYTSGAKTLESGNPSYISLVQLLVQCTSAYVGQQEDGWKLLLYRLPIAEENSGILSFQMKLKPIPESEKVNQIIMYWARGCDNEDKVLYMKTLLQAVQKCQFGSTDTDHVGKLLEELISLETNFKTGSPSSRSSRVSYLVSSLQDKDIRLLHHQITAVTANLNVFPTLDELSVSESDNETPAAKTSSSNKDGGGSVRSINDRLEQLLRDVMEEEDVKKLVAALKHLIMSGREDLVTCIL